METQTTILVDTLRFPESPRWHNSRLYCCDLYTNRVIQIDLDGMVQTIAETADTPASLAWTPEGQLLVSLANARKLFLYDGKALVEFADLSSLVDFPLNDIVIEVAGRVYIGHLGFDFANDAPPQPGSILTVSPDGSSRIVAEDLMFPNGMAITADGQKLIVAESYGACLTAFDIASDGSLSNHRIWAQFAGEGEAQVTPDGICLDAEGSVWLASTSTSEVVRVREGGEITQRIPLAHIPLACMLGGADRRMLFIPTTSGFDPMDSSAKGFIEMLRVEIPGAGLP